ncbi:MAG: hypothetical protein V1722_05990 [Candidatus Micrarchaeota archaeon]
MVFTKLRRVSEVRKKIAEGKPVSIGVFCSGNGDRSPLAHAVLQRELEKAGLRNVRVFSFGTSVSPAKHHGAASFRTTGHAAIMGYDLSSHSRRHIADDDVQSDIKGADILLAISPSHAALAAEFTADEAPNMHRHILDKTWTLKGFANKIEWTLPFRTRLARGLALKDPYFHPKTAAGERAFKRDLYEVEKAAKLAVKRLVH